MAQRHTMLTDAEGVHQVGRTVSRELGWLFREQSVGDQGIDAHVELAIDGHATGRLIALQIKTGASYFRRAKQGGWNFYYSQRERDIWNGHTLPVVVVLVDLKAEKAYWQRISLETERRTKKRYVVNVPPDQELASASEAWTMLASSLGAIARERWEAHLNVLPPQLAQTLRLNGSDSQRELLALNLAEGRFDPASVAERLLTDRPAWMVSEDGWTWDAVGDYCSRHGALDQSSRAFEIAGEHGGTAAGRRLGLAALNAVPEPERAYALIERARDLDGAALAIAIVESILEHPVGDARPMRIDSLMQVGGLKIDSDRIAQSFLSEQAIRSRDSLRALRHASRALELDTENVESMVRMAGICLRRSSTADAQTDDVDQAVNLLSSAVAQIRRWSGSSGEALAQLAKALLVSDRPNEALHWLLPEPHGTATPVEVKNQQLMRLALMAAHSIDSDLVGWIAAQLEDTDENRVSMVRLGLLELDDSRVIELWSAELARAQDSEDHDALLTAVFSLARLGIDKSTELKTIIRRGILPAGSDRLPSAIALVRLDVESGLLQMRSLASEEAPAAEQYISELARLNRVQEASLACERAYEIFRDPSFRVQRAMILVEAQDSGAEAALNAALLVVRNPRQRLAVSTRLASLRSDSGDILEAERLLSDALSALDRPPPGAVWNVVISQLTQAAGHRAAATISRYTPTVSSVRECTLWFQAMSSVPWDSQMASEALALAERFKSEPKVAMSLLTHLISATRGLGGDDSPENDSHEAFANGPVDDRPAVSGELHVRAFALLGELIEAHGPSTGARVLHGDSPEEMFEELSVVLRESRQPDMTALLDMAARGRVPAGMAALALGTTYTQILANRVTGQLVAFSFDADEEDLEIATARRALGGDVVLDLSTSYVLGILDDPETLLSQFASILTSRETKADVVRAVVDVQGLAASPGSIGWDSKANRPWLYERSGEEYRRLRTSVDAMDRLMRRTAIRGKRKSLFSKDFDQGLSATPWASVIEVAAFEGVALWCDDLSVRKLAREFGVESFSSMAIVDLITELSLRQDSSAQNVSEIATMRESITSQLLAGYVVDVPVTLEQLLRQATVEGWSSTGAAAGTLSRPGWWNEWVEPLVGLRRIYAAVKANRPDSLSGWQFQAMLGAARRASMGSASIVLCNLALLGWADEKDGSMEFEALLEGCKNARIVASTFEGLRDPIEHLSESGRIMSNLGFDRPRELLDQLRSALALDSRTD